MSLLTSLLDHTVFQAMSLMFYYYILFQLISTDIRTHAVQGFCYLLITKNELDYDLIVSKDIISRLIINFHSDPSNEKYKTIRLILGKFLPEFAFLNT
jgi:hypothetical protein